VRCVGEERGEPVSVDVGEGELGAGVGLDRSIALGAHWLLALRFLDSWTPTVGSGGGRVQSGITAGDQHQPASSRATATLAMTGRYFRRFRLTQRARSRWLPACPRARAAAGAWS
jgi:hypothetical protein